MSARVIRHDDVPEETFPGGATYRTIVGDEAGSTPVRCGIQTSPPGYATPNHSHPYDEVVTVLEGRGEAWFEGTDTPVEMLPGTTILFPANTVHGFRTVGDAPLLTYGIHASPERIVKIHET